MEGRPRGPPGPPLFPVHRRRTPRRPHRANGSDAQRPRHRPQRPCGHCPSQRNSRPPFSPSHPARPAPRSILLIAPTSLTSTSRTSMPKRSSFSRAPRRPSLLWPKTRGSRFSNSTRRMTGRPASFLLRARHPKQQAAAQSGIAENDDVALVLHTSGTTSRPKIVPLTQSNVCASAAHIQAALSLVSEDRCLNVMPLFHIHGLIGCSCHRWRGAAVVCTPGFSAEKFFAGWSSSGRPGTPQSPPCTRPSWPGPTQ